MKLDEKALTLIPPPELADYKVPSRFAFVTALPRNATARFLDPNYGKGAAAN